jgi:hypothetical protein
MEAVKAVVVIGSRGEYTRVSAWSYAGTLPTQHHTQTYQQQVLNL